MERRDLLESRFTTYNSEIDMDIINIFKAIVDNLYCREAAIKLDLPEKYVELIYTIICRYNLADYGTSPRGCWIYKEDQDVIKILEEIYHENWGKDLGE